MAKKEMTTEYVDITATLSYNKISQVIKELQNILDKYGDKEIDITNYGDYDAQVGFYIDRLETDLELAQRLDRLEKQTAFERKQYEQLKKKFGEA
jgi:uncharacterized protein involved in exopolysaccharide biosynthesis